MATNLSIDPELVERPVQPGGERAKQAAETLALEEFSARRRQHGLLELMRALEWDPQCDHMRERQRGAAPVRPKRIT